MLAYVYSVNDPRVLDLHYLELMKTLIGVHQALLMHDVFILSTYGRRKCTLRNQIGTSTHTRGSTDKHGSLSLELYNRKNPSNCRSVRNQFPFPISLDLNFCSSPFKIFSVNGCKLAIIIQYIQEQGLAALHIFIFSLDASRNCIYRRAHNCPKYIIINRPTTGCSSFGIWHSLLLLTITNLKNLEKEWLLQPTSFLCQLQ
jgi:hypothetical protein